jgi:hypothetical protein
MTKVLGCLLVVLFVAGCDNGPKTAADYGENHGLVGVVERRDMVEASIAIVNAINGTKAGIRLRPSWGPTESNTIPVYWVTSFQLSDEENAFVPDGYGGIIVNARYPDWRSSGASSADWKSPASDLLSTIGVPELLLALTLLHESGHIAHNDNAPIRQDPNKAGEKVSFMNSRQRAEILADLYAANAILEGRSNQTITVVNGVSLSSAFLAKRLSEYVSLEAFNLAAADGFFYSSEGEADRQGAAQGREFPQLSNRGESHPDVTLRFCVLNFKLNPNEVTERLVDYCLGSYFSHGTVPAKSDLNEISLLIKKQHQ